MRNGSSNHAALGKPQAPAPPPQRVIGPAGVADHDPGAFQLAWLVDLETGYTLPCQRYGASRFCCCLNAEAERTRWKVATSEGEVEKLLAGAKVMDKEFCGTFDVPACRCPGEIYDLRGPIVDCDTGRIMVDLRCRRCGKVYGVEAQR